MLRGHTHCSLLARVRNNNNSSNSNHNNHNNRRFTQGCNLFLFCGDVHGSRPQRSVLMAEGDAAGSSARRRRERRLRSFWRHEKLAIQMALSEAMHHSAPRGAWHVCRTQPYGGQKPDRGAAVWDNRAAVSRCPSAADEGPVGGGYFSTLVPVVAEQVIEVPTVVGPPALLAQSSVRRRRQNSWWKCRALLEQLNAARPGRDTNTGRRDGG